MARADEWLLQDDGIVDGWAVQMAAMGLRRVRLTWPERFIAADLIRAAGGSLADVGERLGIGAEAASLLNVA